MGRQCHVFLLLVSLVFVPLLTSCENEITDLTQETASSTVNNSSSISSSTAANIAAIFTGNFNHVNVSLSRNSDPTIQPINNSDGRPVAYIINQENGGWVIVSASTDFYPILAYSDEAQFSLNSNVSNTGLGLWIDQITKAIDATDDLDKETASQIALEWSKYAPVLQTFSIGGGLPGGNSPEAVACRARLKELNDTYYQSGWTFTTLSNVSDIPFPNDVYSLADSHSSPYNYTIVGLRDIGPHHYVAPLLTTEWYQQYPYGHKATNGFAGCVPTAMGQIMKFHCYPTGFDWNNMPASIQTHTDIGADQIISLLYDLGRDTQVQYGLETTTRIDNAETCFIVYGYNTEQKSHKDSDVIHFLESFGSPVFMSGYRSNYSYDTVGHAWVCDGVKQNYSRYEYYVEYLESGTYDNLNASWLDYPPTIDVTTPKPAEFHMNWGEKDLANGWFLDATTSNDSQFNYRRLNIYATPK